MYLQAAPVSHVLDAIVALAHTHRCDGKKLFGPALQRLVLRYVVHHPLAVQFPPRLSFRHALLKQLSLLIESEYATRVRQESEEDTADDDVEEFDEDFLEALLELKSSSSAIDDSSSPGDGASSYKTFLLPPAACASGTEPELGSPKWREELEAVAAAASNSSIMCGCAQGRHDVIPVAMRVGDQFTNVGLSLWPSAYVTVLVLVRLLLHREACQAPESLNVHGAGETLRKFLRLSEGCQGTMQSASRCHPAAVLELGAGVGLTSICLDRLLPTSVAGRFIATDYQPVIVDNCLKNIALNYELVLPFQPTASSSRCEAALLDWTEHDVNAAKIRQWSPDLIVAADCIYDVAVIPALAETLRLALYQPGDDDNKEEDSPPIALVVQTHRNAETIGLFLKHVSRFAVCESYRFVTSESLTTSSATVNSNIAAKCSCSTNNWKLARLEDGMLQDAMPVNGFVGPFFVEMVDRVGLHFLKRIRHEK